MSLEPEIEDVHNINIRKMNSSTRRVCGNFFRGAISSQQETQLGQSRTGSHRVEPIPRTFSSGIEKFGRSSSNPNDRLGRSISNSVDLPAKPEFLPFIASRITQPGPRRQIRICVAFCFLAFCLSTICTGGLAVFIYPTWWLCVVAWIFSAIPVGIAHREALLDMDDLYYMSH
jgi:hypothetical protein